MGTMLFSRLEETLERLVPTADQPEGPLYIAVRHGLFGGGKRLRPRLVLATVETLGAPVDMALVPACALEMIHTYSLIHDDLPALDNDSVRRGRPTVHVECGEAQAILAGDYLLTRAFEILADAEGLSETQRLNLMRVLARNAGGPGMIGGQMLDMLAEGKSLSVKQLESIHSRKTGALITASLLFGAIIAGDRRIHLFEQLGGLLGLAFQIIDDVLDVTCSQEKKGRATSSDVANDKSTYVSLLGLDEARETAYSLLKKAESLLAEIEILPHPLANLARSLVHREI